MVDKQALASCAAWLDAAHRQLFNQPRWPQVPYMPILDVPGLAIDLRLLNDARAQRIFGRSLTTIAQEGGMTLNEVVENLGYKLKRRLASECLNIIKAKATDRGIR